MNLPLVHDDADDAPTGGAPHQVVDPVTDHAPHRNPRPSFVDALAVQRILDAVERSANNTNEWTEIPA